ncbi:MAG: hypothetical protein J4N95_02585 [Chloroflexi bacterium]|nr:hypothetical protein [Chloroflexota bacterium]MCI0889677.1 hypothetical protein [Chloroflexota bacterium]
MSDMGLDSMTVRTRLWRAAGVAALLGVLAMVVVAIGTNSAAPSASATDPTPTKIANDGSLGSVSDILVGDIATGTGIFYCIAKTDHAMSTNEVKTALQCNIDIANAGLAPTGDTPPTWEETCESLADRVPPECVAGQLNNQSEAGPDTNPGPPPPPPYTTMPPSKGYGFLYPANTSPGDACGAVACTIVTSCFEEVGSLNDTGPNVIWTVLIMDPKAGTTIDIDPPGPGPEDVDRVSSGTVDIWYNQNNASCKAGTPKGDPDFDDLALQSIQAYDKGGSNPNPNPAPWRRTAVTTLDFDGDGCTDEEELSKTSAAKCGDDPQNPLDSFDPDTVDLTGIYFITTRLVRADCTNDQCTGGTPGIYIYCRAYLLHDTSDDTLEMRPFCYADNTAVDINPEAYPGITGDGFPGGPPPGPEYPSDGSGDFVYGDIDETHTLLTGTYTKDNPPTIHVFGCIPDPDESTGTGDVWFDITLSAFQLPGTIGVYLFQNPDCAGSPTGTPLVGTVGFARQPKGDLRDDDNDGNPTAAEVQDNAACGRRDPYNKNDYYDVSIPRDGVIDLPNDILGVIIHFAPGGYPDGDENWDRPRVMVGAGLGSHWNRGSPDGVIDLPNDILGVILQFNPGGCLPP